MPGRARDGIPGIEPGSAVCKASTLSTVQWLWALEKMHLKGKQASAGRTDEEEMEAQAEAQARPEELSWG